MGFKISKFPKLKMPKLGLSKAMPKMELSKAFDLRTPKLHNLSMGKMPKIEKAPKIVKPPKIVSSARLSRAGVKNPFKI